MKRPYLVTSRKLSTVFMWKTIYVPCGEHSITISLSDLYVVHLKLNIVCQLYSNKKKKN